MTKRKKAESDISDEDQTVPLPIQTFLWRQSRSKFYHVYVYQVEGYIGGTRFSP